MHPQEDNDAFVLWWKAYASSQEILAKTQGLMADAMARQVMFLVEMGGLSFRNTADLCRAVAEVQRNIVDILAGKVPPLTKPRGMEAGQDERC